MITGSGFRNIKKLIKAETNKRRPHTANRISFEEAQGYINDFKSNLSDDLCYFFDSMIQTHGLKGGKTVRRSSIQNLKDLESLRKYIQEPKDIKYEPIKLKTVRFEDEPSGAAHHTQIKLKSVTISAENLEFGFT